MTSFIDVLVVLTVFLLLTFEPTDACGCIERRVRLPTADGLEMIDAPLVTVAGEQILLDGTPIETDGLFESGRVQRVDGLFDVLKAKREIAKQLQPNKPPPSIVVLKIDVDEPAFVVKSVVRTSARAGYPQISFMVETF